MENNKIGSLILAAIVGSAITLGSYELIRKNDLVQVEHIDKTPLVKTSYSEGHNTAVMEVPASFSSAAEKVMDAVVHIRSTATVTSNGNVDMQNIPEPFRDFFGPYMRGNRNFRPQPRVGSGSGVIISKDGYVVTNNHVIDQADDLEVTLHNNKSFKATVIGTDPTTDLALIKIEESGLPYLALTNSDEAKVGEWVLAVGNPFNLNSTVTAGIISAKGRNIGILGDSTSIESFIQTDAAVNPGNSGGALVNLNGDLVGINTAIASPTGAYSGYSFAIPSNIVSKVVEDLINYGTVQRGWLGVTIQNVNAAVAKENNLEVSSGAYVVGFADASGAKQAGVKEGDVIINVDDRPVMTTSNLIGYVGSKRPGDVITLKVNRDGKDLEYKVTLKNREGNTKIVKKEKNELLMSIGIDLEELDKAELKQLGLEHGVRVSTIRPGKISRNTDMREGFIITKIDGTEISSKNDVINILENKEGGVLIEGTYGKGSGNYYYGLGI